jgi:hypothetical protein
MHLLLFVSQLVLRNLNICFPNGLLRFLATVFSANFSLLSLQKCCVLSVCKVFPFIFYWRQMISVICDRMMSVT